MPQFSMASIQINGELRDVEAANVTALMAELEFDPRTVLVEHKGRALHRSEWAQSNLADDDRIEILRVVAGG